MENMTCEQADAQRAEEQSIGDVYINANNNGNFFRNIAIGNHSP